MLFVYIIAIFWQFFWLEWLWCFLYCIVSVNTIINRRLFRYYFGTVLQFQIHKAMCLASGQYRPNDPNKLLHKCDIYRSKEAGAIIKWVNWKIWYYWMSLDYNIGEIDRCSTNKYMYNYITLCCVTEQLFVEGSCLKKYIIIFSIAYSNFNFPVKHPHYTYLPSATIVQSIVTNFRLFFLRHEMACYTTRHDIKFT